MSKVRVGAGAREGALAPGSQVLDCIVLNYLLDSIGWPDYVATQQERAWNVRNGPLG